MTASRFWSERFADVPPKYWAEAGQLEVDCLALTPKAKFKTGSISIAASVALRVLSEWVKPQTAIEVGTFIGYSTRSIRSSRIYTCDASNDCVQPDDRIVPHPYQSSTQMFRALVAKGVVSEFFFFDGRLQYEPDRGLDDSDLVFRLSLPNTVYVFDDYAGREKGWCNVELLRPRFPGHVFFSPALENTTLALLVPESRL